MKEKAHPKWLRRKLMTAPSLEAAGVSLDPILSSRLVKGPRVAEGLADVGVVGGTIELPRDDTCGL